MNQSQKPLKCCFIITSMPVGGAETLLVNLMRRMNPDSIRPEVLCLKEPGPLGQELALEFPVHSNLIRGKYDAGVVFRLANRLRRSGADAVVTVGAGDKMFWGRLAAWVAGVPVIASALHSTGWPDGVGRLNRLLTPITDAFIGVADSHGEFLREFEKFPAGKVNVIRNGIDCERFQFDPTAAASVREELGLSQASKLCGIVAALRPEKNHGMLIEAASRLKESHPDLHTVVIGDGPERSNIVDACHRFGVTDRIHLLGNRSDTPRLLSALDVFTLCSLNEASPVSILESLACQTPVVSTDVGSIRETVIEGETGRCVASEDVSAFASAIAGILVDEPARRRMGQLGRQQVLRSGSLDSMVSGYENLIHRIHQRKRQPTAAPETSRMRAAIAEATSGVGPR